MRVMMVETTGMMTMTVLVSNWMAVLMNCVATRRIKIMAIL